MSNTESNCLLQDKLQYVTGHVYQKKMNLSRNWKLVILNYYECEHDRKGQ